MTKDRLPLLAITRFCARFDGRLIDGIVNGVGWLTLRVSQAYRLFELKRWSRLWGLPLNLQPKFFPVPADLASRWILAALEQGPDAGLKLAGAFMRAVWAEDRNVSDADTLASIAREQGFDAAALGDRAAAEAIGSRYEALTQEAIDAQVFGAPTFIYRDEPFWGQDRLDFLDRSLAK